MVEHQQPTIAACPLSLSQVALEAVQAELSLLLWSAAESVCTSVSVAAAASGRAVEPTTTSSCDVDAHIQQCLPPAGCLRACLTFYENVWFHQTGAKSDFLSS